MSDWLIAFVAAGICLLWGVAGFVVADRRKETATPPETQPWPQGPPKEATVWMIDGEPTMEYMVNLPEDGPLYN